MPQPSDKQRKSSVRGRPFPPGQSGNPNGRPPKGYSITETLKEMMGAKPEIKQALGTKLIELALKGDLAAIKLLMSYLDGNPIQRTELTGADGAPVQFETLVGLVKEASLTPARESDTH